MSGATFSLFHLASGLAEQGHQIHCACSRETLLWQMLSEKPNVKLHHVPFRRYLDFPAIRALVRLVRGEGIQVISAQGGKDRNLTILAKWLYRLPVLIVFTRRQRLRNEPWIKRWFHVKGTAAIVMVSHGLKQLFVKRGYPARHLPVIHNGVNPASIDEVLVQKLKERYHISGKVIGCVARKKRQLDVIRAFERLPDDYMLLLVGVSREEFQSELVSPLTHRIVFTGTVPHEEARALISLMDIHVLPSHMDGFGLSTVEAMLQQVPVIGSDYGGIPDVIKDGKTGLLYQNGDSKGLAKKIQVLMENRQLREEFIARAYDHAVKNFTVERTVLAYENLFQKLLEENTSL